ncbi:MAG: hypothetical protein SOY60_07250, partial [Fusobacterium gastrosuis]|uniref:hypothetical protein n=1 Tax=Fusobacterium gastrosuis TaxID=1755100 RepID=UPI002A8B6069|nr:hypothetical protein [Fusobacterium gastrosuis]
SIAVGKDSKSSGGQAVAIGRKTNASGHSSIAIGTGDPKSVPGAGTSFVNGVWDDTLKEVKLDDKVTTRPNETEASGFMSTAIGQRAVSKGISSIAIGTSAYAVEKEAVAIGILSAASGGAAVAIGSNAASKAEDTVAVGFGAKANKNYGVAIGSGAVAGGNVQDKDSKGIDTIAIGKGAKALADKAISIGTGNVVSGEKSGAIGDPSYISGTGTYTIGNDNGTDANKIAADNSGIFGNSNKMSAAAGNSRVIGNSNNVTHQKSFILGNNITTGAENSVYLGDSSAINTTTSGLATGTVTNGTVGNITYGNFAGATSKGAVTVGSAGNERRIQNVAAGKISADSTDVINGSQLYVVADKLGNEVESIYFHTNDGTTTQEAGNSTTNKGKITDKAGATGTYAISAGVNTTATNAQAIAIGRNVTATGKSSIAIGNGDNQYETDNVALRKIDYDPIKKEMVVKDSATTIKASTATGEMALAIGGRTVSSGLASTAVGPYSHSSGQQATAIGAFAAASGETSTAIGTFASAKDVSTTAIGEGSKAEKKEATALGSSAIAAEIQATAIGYGAKASHDNSIALGSNSITKAGVDRTTNPVTINSIQYSGFVGNGEKNGVVSVGDTGKERQIVNVAAGEISKTSTDAINGSQLYMTNKVVGNVAESLKGKLGGNAKYEPTGDTAGTFTMTNIGDTNQNTIHDAIKAAKTKIVAGKNISSVNETTEADGSRKYTIDAYKTTVEKADGDTLVTVTGGTADTTNNEIKYKVGVTKGTFEADGGKIKETPTTDGIATVSDVAKAVNAGYWTAKVGGTELKKVKFGDNVDFVNGKGTTAVSKNGGVTYDLNLESTDNTITIADGTDGKVNLKVNTANLPKTKMAAGKNTTVEGTGVEGDPFKVNAIDTKLTAKNGKVTVEGGDAGTDNIRTYTVGLSKDTEASIEKVNTQGITFTGNTGTTTAKKLGETLAVNGKADEINVTATNDKLE